MRNIRCTACIIAAVLAVLLALTGCSGMGNDNMRNNTGTPQGLRGDRNEGIQGRMLDNDVNDGDIGDQNRDGAINDGDNMNGTNGTARQRAMRIKAECEKMPGVNDAEVLINGDTAIIGCRTTQDINALRQRIESKVRQLEPSIKNVSVTNARDLLIEIRNLADEIGDGPDASNLDARVRQLINRITPKQ